MGGSVAVIWPGTGESGENGSKRAVLGRIMGMDGTKKVGIPG